MGKGFKKINKKDNKLKDIDYKRLFLKYDYLILLFIIISLFLVANFQLTKNFKSVPSCIYGCDLHHEMGLTLDTIHNPQNTWQSSAHDWLNVTGSPKSILYIRAFFHNIISNDDFNVFNSITILSYFFIAISLFGWFLFYDRIFKNKFLNVFLSSFSFVFTTSPYYKGSQTIFVFLPYLLLSFIMLYNIKKDYSIYKKLMICFFSIFMIVLVSNIQPMIFFIAYFLLGIGYLLLVLETYSIKKIIKKFKNKLFLTKTFLVAFVGIISLLINFLIGYWYRIIFVHKGSVNAYKFDIHASLNNPDVFFPFTLKYIKSIFFSFNNITNTILTISVFVGLFILLFMKIKNNNKEINIDYIKWIVITFFFSVFNYLLTVPLLHMHLSPTHAIGFLSSLFKGVMLGFVIYFLFYYFRKKINYNVKKIIILLLIIIFSYSTISASYDRVTNDKFWKQAKNDIPPNYIGLQDWYENNDIDASDTILISTNELSFAVFGFTGTKLLTGRHSHFFHTTDFQKIWMDAAILFYGNDSENRKDILTYYNDLAKSKGKKLYLYWDYYWINSEWHIQNEQAYPFDPLRFEYSKQRENTLKNNNISYIVRKNVNFEPSARPDHKATKLDVIYISPQNYRNQEKPWNKDLDKYLTEVWNFTQNNVVYARLYEINLN